MPLVRVASGLLARHRANDPHRPFAATDWAAPSGVTLGVSSGALTITGNPIGWRAVRRAAAQARSRGLVQVVGRTSLGQATWLGPAAHIDSLTDPDVVGLVGSVGRTPTENTRLLEFENGSQTDLASSAVPARSTNTSYRFSVFVDGSSAVGHDHDNEITLSGTAPNREGGYFGILLGRTAAQAPTYTILEYYECADRYLRVTGLPPGYQVRVGDAVGVADASGEAVVDMLAVPFPQEVLEILDADGYTVTALETPIGLWGGDEWSWLDAPRLTRATAGLLARHEAGSSTHPFSVADWDVPSGVTVSVDAQGRLALSSSPLAVWRHIHHRHVPSRTRVFTQSLAARTSGIWGGDAAHADAGGTNHVRIQWSYGRPQGEMTALAQNTGNTETSIGQGTIVPARASGVDYRFSLWVDGAEVVGHDHGNALTISGTSTTHTSGGVGCALGGGAVGRRYSAYYVMADRYLRVTGLPAGYSVRIGELVEAAAGGAAVFDLLAVALPLASDTIEVLDGSGNVVAALTPDGGVWGGDEYEFSGEPEPEPENPWEPCPPPPAAEWEPCEEPVSPVRLEAFAWWPLQEASAGDGASDATGNGHDGTYGPDVIFRVPGPGGGSKYAVRVSATSPTVGLTTPSIDSGAGGNFTSPGAADSNPNYRAPTIHTNFTMAVTVRPTETTAIPSKMSDPPGTGHIVDAQTPNRFINRPAHGNRGNPNDSTDIHAGVALIIGTNAVIVAEHAHNHAPVRAIYEGDLSGWHRICFVYRGDPRLAGAVRIYIDGVYARELPGSYGEGSSVKVRPFLVGPWLTFGSQAFWINNFGGDVADLTVWDRALTDEEIMADAHGAGLWEPAFVRPSTSWERC